MNLLYFIRHGENPANLTKEFSHRKVDYPLTPKGRMQAQQTAEHFRNQGIDEIYASPLKRAFETAEIIGRELGLPVTVREDFREVNVGTLEDMPPSAEAWALHNEIIRDWVDGKSDTRFPGGEDYHELWGRLHTALQSILARKDGRKILVVAHGGILTLPLRSLCPDADYAWLRTQQNANCSITRIEAEISEGKLKARLLSYASFDHLHGEAAQLVSGIPNLEVFKK